MKKADQFLNDIGEAKPKFTFEDIGGEGNWKYFEVSMNGKIIGNVSVFEKKGVIGIVPQDNEPGIKVNDKQFDEFVKQFSKFIGKKLKSAIG